MLVLFCFSQAFYPVENPVEIKYGDILAARCVFTGEGRTSETYIGYVTSLLRILVVMVNFESQSHTKAAY